ncbi:Rhamnan synthesis protein F [compost metagenome]
MPQAKTISLESGYYKLSLRNINPELSAIELFDVDDVERCCRLVLTNGQLHYALQLRTTLNSANIRLLSENPADQETCIEFIPVSKRIFSLQKAWSAIQRHRLQSFGPGEKLLYLSGSQDTAEAAAFANVEYRALRLYGLDDLSKEANEWYWLDNDLPTTHTYEKRRISSSIRACVYLHLHYLETWPEIKSTLLQNCADMDIVISVTSQDADFENKALTAFPNARIVFMENRGRDVGPFMELLKQGFFDHYDAVCKIHGKLSRKNGNETISGHRIRRYTLACLLANGACSHILNCFSENPDLGLLGPRNLHLPLQGKQISQYIKNELDQMREVFKRAGVAFDPQETQFFVGTMFWFRPAALQLLRRADIGIMDFALENGAKKGTLQHSLERSFSSIVRKAGYKIAAQQPMLSNGMMPILEFI